jgi:DNA-binding NarL/FixJ family response regulator
MILTRVVLADDHPALRLGIRMILGRAPDINVVGEASDGVQTLHLVEDLAPDVLLLDMEMPGLTGVEVAQRLKAAGSSVRILALSSYDDKQYILGLLVNGVLGYLLKEEAPEKIIAAVRGVARGERHWVSQRVVAQMSTWDQEEKESGGTDTNQIKS